MRTLKLSNSPLEAIVDDHVYPIVSQFRWFLGGKCSRVKDTKKTGSIGYPTTRITTNGKSLLVKLDRFVLPPAPKGYVTDHINGDSLDNRAANLRHITHSENLHNTTVRADSTTGCKGVSPHPRRKGIFQVIAWVRGRKYWVGNYKSKEEAAKAYVDFIDLGKNRPELLPPLVRNKSGVRGISAASKGRWTVRWKGAYVSSHKSLEEAKQALNQYHASL